MDPKELTRRVLRELAAERASYGYGSAAAIDQRMGKGKGYLGRVLRGEVGLNVETLFAALAALEADPADFFVRVVGTRVRPERLLRRIERQGNGDDPAILDLCERLLAGEEEEKQDETVGWKHSAAELAGELDRLEEERFSDAAETSRAEAVVEAAARRAAARHDEDSLSFLARALGVLAPFYRLEARFAAAARCLRLALGPRPPAEVRAELLQRICYLLADQGEYRVAAEIARMAVDAYVGCRNEVGIGKALVDRAIMLEHAGDSEAAAEAYLNSLRYLPDDERTWANRFSVHQGLGWIYARRGELDAAQVWADKAAAWHKTRDGQNWFRLVWLQGEIALRRGQVRSAQRLLREARAGFTERGNPFDVAVVSLRLAKALFVAGQVREMHRVAAEMLCLLKPLRKHRVASATIQEFTRAALAGEVTLELLDQAYERLEKGRPRGGAAISSL